MTALTLSVSDGLSVGETAALEKLPGLVLTLSGLAQDDDPPVVVNLVERNTLPILVFWLVNEAGDAYPLEQATVTFRMRARDGEQGDYVVERACTWRASGCCELRLEADDTETPGEYEANVLMVLGGFNYTSKALRVVVREKV